MSEKFMNEKGITGTASSESSFLSLETLMANEQESLEEALHEALTIPGFLHEAMAYHLKTGGKRLRAHLPVLVAKNLGANAEQLDRARRYGRGIELIHNGTLVHDDLQDGDKVRRNSETIWVRYGAAQAINVGTAFLHLGLKQFEDAPSSLWNAVNQAIIKVVEGQAREFVTQDLEEPTVASWDVIVVDKTAALFALSLRAGLSALGGPGGGPGHRATVKTLLGADFSVEAFVNYGLDLGRFFQLQDDVLDLLGDKGREKAARDIAEGKMSWPMVWAAEHGEARDWERLRIILKTKREDTTEAMTKEALSLLEQTGALDASRREMKERGKALLEHPLSPYVKGLVEQIFRPLGWELE